MGSGSKKDDREITGMPRIFWHIDHKEGRRPNKAIRVAKSMKRPHGHEN